MLNKDDVPKIWWLSLTLISVLNIIILSSQYKNTKNLSIFVMAFIYIIVNAIRAIWPRIDIERICFFDANISTPLVGRFLATIAELCYIGLFIITLKLFISTSKDFDKYSIILNLIFIVILIAEILSWCGCLTKKQLFNAFEESLWGFSAVVILIISLLTYKEINNKKIKNYLLTISLCLLIYITFMVLVDIPMYIKRDKIEIIDKNTSLDEQIKDMSKCNTISKDYNTWKEDIPWLSGYFSLGSWSAIILLILYNKNINRNS